MANHMKDHTENQENLIQYEPKWNSYFIVIRDDASSRLYQEITYCPWCGERLPPSKFREWHETLESMGLDWARDRIPAKFQTDEWWT